MTRWRDLARPETDVTLLERHRVEDGAERIRLLVGLAAAHTPVALHVGGPHGSGVSARLETVDAEAGSLSITLDMPPDVQVACRTMLRSAGGATGVAIQPGAKLQFPLDGLTCADDDSRAALRARLPTTLVRLQRRDAYRIAPSPLAFPRLWLRDSETPQTAHAVAVTDLSATGVSFRVPATGPTPAIGDRLDADPLELPATLPIRCALRVRVVAIGADGELRVGCAFEGLEPAAERTLQVFVNAAQVRGRTPKPQLGG